MRIIVALLACSVLLTACAALPAPPAVNSSPPTTNVTPPARVVPYTLVSRGAPLGDHPKDAFYGVVTSPQAWDDIQSKIPEELVAAGKKDGQVGKVIYLAAFSGAKASSGYSLDIQKITCLGSACTLFLDEKEPGAETIVEPAMTLPYLLISVQTNQFTRGSKVIFIFKSIKGGAVYQQETTIP